MGMAIGEMFMRLGVEPGDLSGIETVNKRVRMSLAEAVGSARTAVTSSIVGDDAPAGSRGRSEREKGIKVKQADTDATRRNDLAHLSLTKTLNNIVNPLNILRMKVLAVFAATTYATKSAGEYAASLTRFHLVTGLSVQGLQAMQQAFAGSGVSMEETAGAIESIQRATAEIKMGSGNLAPWYLLGIDPRQSDPISVMGQIKGAMGKVSTEFSTLALRQIGLTDAMIAAIKEAASLPPPNKEFLLSDKEITRLKQFDVFWNRTVDDARRGMQKIGYMFMPVAELIVYGVHRISLAFARISKYFSDHGKIAREWGIILAGAMLMLAVAVAPAIVGVLLLVVALEDLLGYMNGDDSMTGEFMDSFKDWNTSLETTASWLETILSYVRDMIGLLPSWVKWLPGAGLAMNFTGIAAGAAGEVLAGSRGDNDPMFSKNASNAAFGVPPGTKINAPVTINQTLNLTPPPGTPGNFGPVASLTQYVELIKGATKDVVDKAQGQLPKAVAR